MSTMNDDPSSLCMVVYPQVTAQSEVGGAATVAWHTHKKWRNLHNGGLRWRKSAQFLIHRTSLNVLFSDGKVKTRTTGRHSELQRAAISENLEVA